MLIVADENIPFAREVFAPLGEVRTLGGRAMTPEVVRDAELLLVRSVTKVNRELLEGSRVRFVATATIGFDHVDRAYLDERGIAFASAPGSNAQSVAEYVCAALLVLEARQKTRLSGGVLAVIGVGNVGARVARVGRTLGMDVLLNDPPRARSEGSDEFVTLNEACAKADVITFHVPLARGGSDPTFHLIDEALLARLKPGATLINSSRGGVQVGAALKEAKRSGRLRALVLDVFEGEPAIDAELADAADLMTPHIAGYSYDGKVAGTRMIYEAACRFLARAAPWPDGIPPREELLTALDAPALIEAVRASYDIEVDDERLRVVLDDASAETRAQGFDRLRKGYPRRREFANWTVRLTPAQRALEPQLKALGFCVLS
jgi:erythronate-4-phosphate dehydrogenase